MATTVRCSSSLSVTLSPVVPQGTRTSIPSATCRATSRRRAASSRAPSSVNGVTSATPAPANDLVMFASPSRISPAAALTAPLRRAPPPLCSGGRPDSSRSAALQADIAHRPQPLAGFGGHRRGRGLSLEHGPQPRPLASRLLEEELELAAGQAEVVRTPFRQV